MEDRVMERETARTIVPRNPRGRSKAAAALRLNFYPSIWRT